MSSLRRARLPATLFRLTLAYAGLFVVATLAVLIGGGEIAYRIERANLRTSVERETAELAGIHAQGGMQALVAEVDARALETEERGVLYRVEVRNGERIAGALEATAPASGWFDFTPIGEDADEVYSALARPLPDGKLVVAFDPEPLYDLRELTSAGAFWTLAISLPLALLCGAIVSARVLRRIRLISDTTERVRAGNLTARVPASGADDEFDRLAANVNRMLDSVEALTKNIENVTVGIAHDLRTPLSRVRNRLESLKDAKNGAELQAAKIESALKDMGDLLTTFDALLRIGQIDAGTQRAGFRTLDLSGLVAELVDTYTVVAAAEQKALEAEIAPGLEAFGDRALLTQMLANTLDNAVQHTSGGARIDVRLRRSEDGRVECVIADNGPGIVRERLDQVLKPFRSFDQNGGRNHGLGLSIVHAIAKLHGVDMRLEDNQPGLRVVFAFQPHAA